MPDDARPPISPYIAGVLLGVLLVASVLILGAGLGASGALGRLAAWLETRVAPTHTLTSDYFGAHYGAFPLQHYVVAMLLGVFLGGLVSSAAAGRLRIGLERGRAASASLRVALVVVGGLIAGYAARLARGCPSEHGITGNAMLANGALVFTLCLLAGGYAAAWLVGRQWRD